MHGKFEHPNIQVKSLASSRALSGTVSLSGLAAFLVLIGTLKSDSVLCCRCSLAHGRESHNRYLWGVFIKIFDKTPGMLNSRSGLSSLFFFKKFLLQYSIVQAWEMSAFWYLGINFPIANCLKFVLFAMVIVFKLWLTSSFVKPPLFVVFCFSNNQ